MTDRMERELGSSAAGASPWLVWGLRISVFSIPLLVYVLTLCPTCGPGDAAELATSGALLGICHPPGYPLYVLLSRLFVVLLPVGTAAARVNALSAVFGALALLFLYESLRRMLDMYWAPWVACLVLAFSRAWWLASVTAEVYAMNAFFLAVLLWLATLARENSPRVNLVLLAYVLGISLTHHPTILLAVPALLYILRPRMHWRLKEILPALLAGMLALTLYGYIPIRVQLDPPYVFGSPRGLEGLWHHVTAAGYQSNVLPAGWASLAAGFRDFPRFLSEGIPVFLLWAPAIGLVVCRRAGGFFLRFMAILAVPYAAFVLAYAIPDISAYYLPIHIVLASLAAPGFQAAASRILSWGRGGGKPRFRVAAVSAYVAAACLVAGTFLTNLPWCDRSNHRLAEAYGQGLLETAARVSGGDGFLFVLGDHAVFPVTYLRLVESVLPGVEVYDQAGVVLKDVYGDRRLQVPCMDRSERAAIERDLILRHPGSVFYSQKEKVAGGLGVPYRAVGLLFQPSAEPLSAETLDQVWASYRFPAMDNPHLYGDVSSRAIGGVYFQRRAQRERQRGDNMRALEALEKAGRIAFDVAPVQARQVPAYLTLGETDRAISAAERALELSPGLPTALNNLGNVYYMARRWDEARSVFREAIERAPDLAVVYSNLASVYSAAGQPTRSLALLETALALDPGLANARYNFALALVEVGRKDEGVAHLERLVDERPGHPYAGALLKALRAEPASGLPGTSMMLTFIY
ncbi:MAG: DUF2723 domain-containing protein [Candidatus Eisenbacteria sp.]|nr:DUF2723 domain-containing protein [Candidatus Eisenbacteria bacterium]